MRLAFLMPLFYYETITGDDSCEKYSFENFAVSQESGTIELIFLIRICFVCSNSFAPLNPLFMFQWDASKQLITGAYVQNKFFYPSNKFSVNKN